jgi:transposase
MSSMHLIKIEMDEAFPTVMPFALMRDRVMQSLEERRGKIESMYSPVMGRPEADPVMLMGVTVLQILARLPDRACAEACLYDARWRLALGDVPRFHPTTLVKFRNRIASHGNAKIVLESCLGAMRDAGYLKSCAAVRIDSTHLLGRIADISRLECVRETLRFALEFLAEFGGAGAWEPCHGRYSERNPEDLRNASAGKLASCMEKAGSDMKDVLAKADALGVAVAESEPVSLLRRVFGEQFEESPVGLSQKRASDAGAVINPHDPDAQWSTKKTLGEKGWHGYKAQVCETVEDVRCVKGEPTRSVITAIHVQPAIHSDHGSVPIVLAEHQSAVGADCPPPTEVFVDAGYVSAPALIKAEATGYTLTGPMPAPPNSRTRFSTDSFIVNIPSRLAICPAGNNSSECDRINDAKYAQYGYKYYFAWPRKTCAACPLREQCLSKKKKLAHRTIEVSEHHMTVQTRRNLCKTQEYQKHMYKRSAIEGSHSELVRGYGLRKCRYKGRLKTELQSQFTATACNLHRWARRLCWEERKMS